MESRDRGPDMAKGEIRAAHGHGINCRGPDDRLHTKPSLNHQQGHMECLMCHINHTRN